MLRFSIIYVNTLTDPARYYVFYLEHLETSLMRYTGEIKDLVGPVSADYTTIDLSILITTCCLEVISNIAYNIFDPSIDKKPPSPKKKKKKEGVACYENMLCSSSSR